MKGFMLSIAGGKYTEILPPGWAYAYAYSINNSGQVVGFGSDGTSTRGFMYNTDGTYTYLQPSGWVMAQATSINNSGQVVGYGSDGTTMKGFMFTIADGKYTEILPSGWTSAEAYAINDNGAVVGWDPSGATGKGFIAAPPPPPPVSVSPEDEIDGIIDTIDQTLAGEDCGKVHMKGLEQKLTMAAHAVEKGKIKKGLQQA